MTSFSQTHTTVVFTAPALNVPIIVSSLLEGTTARDVLAENPESRSYIHSLWNGNVMLLIKSELEAEKLE